MTAPDRPGDRDQQQAAEAVPPATLLDRMLYRTGYEDGAAAARAKEAARWQAKIEALADWYDGGGDGVPRVRGGATSNAYAAKRIRALLDGGQ